MNVTTNKGQTFDVLWCWGPLHDADEVMLALHDDRPIPEIALDFDGLTELTATDKDGKARPYIGYSELRGITRNRGSNKVTITLERSEGA